MKEKSKQILLWGIKIILERYFNEPFKKEIDYNFIKQIFNLLSADTSFVTDNYQIEGADRFALRSVFTKTSFCEGEPALDPEGKLYFKPQHGLSEQILLPENKSNFQRRTHFEHKDEELASCKLGTSAEKMINLLFKYGANVPVFNELDCIMPLYEYIKVMAALATNPEGNYRLLLGDLSGIQNFIYTIDSRSALKVLRARSFYLELLTKSVAYEICKELELTSANVLYSGGGNFLLLLPDIEKLDLDNKINSYYQNVNNFFLTTFQGNVHLAMANVKVQHSDFETIKRKWRELHQTMNSVKKQKFLGLLKDTTPEEASMEECRICHTDDRKNTTISDDQCEFCQKLLKYGATLKDLNKVTGKCAKEPSIGIPIPSIKKGLCWSYETDYEPFNDQVFSVNKIPDDDATMMFYCDYVITKRDEKGNEVNADFEYLAKQAIGADLIGTLAMDVDNMGKVFSHGIKTDGRESDYLILVPTISRNLDYFFKYALKNICNNPDFRACSDIKDAPKKQARNVSVIYSGGDDLLLTGAWNDVVEVAYDIHDKFEKFTCMNSDMGLSGGIYISQPKFPFYISVQKAQEAEKKAKGNGVKCLGGIFDGRNYKETIIWNKSTKYEDPCKRKPYKDNDRNNIAEENLSLKNSIYLFYDDTLDFQVDLIDEKSGLKNRYVRALKWKEAKETVKSDLKKFLKADLCMYQEKEKNITFEFPRSFITKLYDMVHKFRTLNPGILYLPDFVYHYSRFDSARREKLKKIFNTYYNRYDLDKDNQNPIFYLPVILTWIELLTRQKGEK